MNYFEEASLRLKQELGCKMDKEVAGLLGLSPVAWVGRKKRNNFPETELYALAAKRPELAIDVNYVLTGIPATQRQADAVKTMLTTSLELKDEKLMQLAHEAVRSISALNMSRQQPYISLLELLNDCSDDTLEMVTQLVEQLRLADIHKRK